MGSLDGSSLDESQVQAVVRRYLARIARRYLPLMMAAIALLVVVAVVPTVEPSRPGTSYTAAGGGGSRTLPAGSTPGQASPVTGPTGAAAGLTGSANSGVGAVSAPSGPQAAPVAGSPSQPGARGASGGATASSAGGGACGAAGRQVSWSKYAPVCAPASHGGNGGATAPGVTASTITITYRQSSSGEASVLSAEEGAAGTSDPGYIADLRTYINLFNRDYQLYGRHVVLKPFQGQGDWVQEEQGQDLGAAQADAVTAQDMGAFGDLSLNSNTQPYSQDLAQNHVIAFGAVFMPQSWFQTYSPYEYSIVPTGTQWSSLWANTICTRMAGLPAVFSGNLKTQTRKFGILVGDAPTYAQDGNELQSRLQSQCGVKLAKRAAYSINFAAYGQQAVSIVAQMKAAGVTSFICGCDPIMMAALSSAADQQQYYPEWLTVYWGDPGARLSTSDQWSHALVNGGQSPAARDTEAYRAFKLISPGAEPAEQYFPVPYEALLQIFAALQGAGPDLTPATYQRAMFSLPPSLPGGDFGDWAFGPGAFTPGVDTHLGWWDPSVTSKYDGKQGAWENCEGGKLFHYNMVSDYGPAHTQPHCFGQ